MDYNDDMKSVYDEQVKTLRKANRNFILLTAGVLVMMIIGLLAWTIAINRERQEAFTQVYKDGTEQTRQLTEETLENRKRNNAMICIITTPAPTRTQADIDRCLEKYELTEELYR